MNIALHKPVAGVDCSALECLPSATMATHHRTYHNFPKCISNLAQFTNVALLKSTSAAKKDPRHLGDARLFSAAGLAAWAAADALHTNFYHLCLSQQTKTSKSWCSTQKWSRSGPWTQLLRPSASHQANDSEETLMPLLKQHNVAAPEDAGRQRGICFLFYVCWRKNNFFQPPPLRLRAPCVR